MKFTKRAYIKVRQNYPEDEREDTTITLYDYEDANELNRILEIYKNNPDPLFCHNCGQRFKHVGQNQLASKQPRRHPTHAQTQNGNATNVRLCGV